MICPLCEGDHTLSNCPRWRMKLLILIPLVLLTGCSTSPKWLENRVACTADGKEAHVLSKWGPVSIGARLADSDAKVVCSR
jgi:uncharacterized lipoprotein YajG